MTTVLLLIGTERPQGNLLLAALVREAFVVREVVVLATEETLDASNRLCTALRDAGQRSVLPPWLGVDGKGPLDPLDLLANYEYALAALDAVGQELGDDRLVLGYLGGTKSMALAMVLAAMDWRGDRIKAMTLATVEPGTGACSLVDVTPSGDFARRSSPGACPPHPLEMLIDLAGLQRVPMRELSAATLNRHTVDVAWSLWVEHPSAYERVLHHGVPWRDAGTSSKAFARLLHPGCTPTTLATAVARAAEAWLQKHARKGPVLESPIRSSPDWSAAAEAGLDALASYDSGGIHKSPEDAAGDAIACLVGAEPLAAKKITCAAARTWLEEGSLVDDRVPWGDVWRQRLTWKPPAARFACTPCLPGLPYAIPSGPEELKPVGREGLRALSQAGRRALMADLAGLLSAASTRNATSGGDLFECAVAVAVTDAVAGLPVRVYASSSKFNDIELDLLLLGPNDRLVVLEVKSRHAQVDSRLATARNAEAQQRLRDQVAAGETLKRLSPAETGSVKPQQHGAQLRSARKLLGVPPTAHLYAVPGHIENGELERIRGLERAVVLPSWGSRDEVREMIMQVLGLR